MSLCLFFFFPKQSDCIQWFLRKASHFLRRYQASPGLIVLSFQQWPPLPDQQAPQRFSELCVHLEKLPSGFCFLQGRILIWDEWEGSSAPRAWPKGRINCVLQSSLSGYSQGGPKRGQDVAPSSADSAALWVFILFPCHPGFMRAEAHEINWFLLSLPGPSLEGKENCKSWCFFLPFSCLFYDS
jgi:hypothetical protein